MVVCVHVLHYLYSEISTTINAYGPLLSVALALKGDPGREIPVLQTSYLTAIYLIRRSEEIILRPRKATNHVWKGSLMRDAT